MKSANKIFIAFYILLLLSIGILNYICDPYHVFKPETVNINPDFNNDPYLQIKLSKNKKAQSVIIGGSSAKYLNIQKFKPEIADISTYYATIQDVYNILVYYLDAHPETKTVYFALELKLFDKREKDTTIQNKKYLTIKELYKLFLSFDTTKMSIKKLIRESSLKKGNLPKLINIENEYTNKEINRIIPPKNKEEYYNYAIEQLSKLFSETKNRNIEIICFMPPFHANYQLRMHKNFGEQIKKIKKYVTNETGFLIDMDTVNDYTTTSLNNSKDYFYDEIHISDKYAKYISDILFNLDNSNKDLYVILNKENIDQQLKIQETKLQIYAQKHKDEYNKYIKKESQKWKKFHLKEH